MKANMSDGIGKFLSSLGTLHVFVDDMLILDVVEFDDGFGGVEEGYVSFISPTNDHLTIIGKVRVVIQR